jgi:hypothetical protein
MRIISSPSSELDQGLNIGEPGRLLNAKTAAQNHGLALQNPERKKSKGLSKDPR